jgi:hypothetical protein
MQTKTLSERIEELNKIKKSYEFEPTNNEFFKAMKVIEELEEELKNNLEKTEECCPIETAEAAWNMSEVNEVERALEELKKYFRDNKSNHSELLKLTQNLVNALEAEKNQKKLGLNAIFPNAEYVYSESNLDIPEPTITFQTPDQPELGFNSPTWSDMPKPELKIKTGTMTASEVSEAWEAILRKL